MTHFIQQIGAREREKAGGSVYTRSRRPFLLYAGMNVIDGLQSV